MDVAWAWHTLSATSIQLLVDFQRHHAPLHMIKMQSNTSANQMALKSLYFSYRAPTQEPNVYYASAKKLFNNLVNLMRNLSNFYFYVLFYT